MSTMTRGDVTASLINLVKRDARRRNRRKALGKFLGALLASALLSLAYGWYLMLAVGVVHHEWIAGCPTIGYWWSVLLSVLLRSALAPWQKSEADR